MITLTIDYGQTEGTVGKIHAPGCRHLVDGTWTFETEANEAAALAAAAEDGDGFMETYRLCECAKKVIRAAR